MDQKKQELIQVSLTNSGAYFIYSVPNVKRGIRGKTRDMRTKLLFTEFQKINCRIFVLKTKSK